METVALNIETMANEALRGQLPPPDVKLGNMVDPIKIKAKVEGANEKQAEKMALDPFFGKVFCASMAVRRDGEMKCVTISTRKVQTEEEIIGWVWKQLSKPDRRLVTFNGAAFDIPFLRLRSIVLSLKDLAIPSIQTGKWKVLEPSGSHFDVMSYFHEEFGNPLGVKRGLSFYALRMLGEDFPFADVDQSNMGNNDSLIELAEQLCEWNTTRTLALWEKIAALQP